MARKTKKAQPPPDYWDGVKPPREPWDGETVFLFELKETDVRALDEGVVTPVVREKVRGMLEFNANPTGVSLPNEVDA